MTLGFEGAGRSRGGYEVGGTSGLEPMLKVLTSVFEKAEAIWNSPNPLG